MPAKPKSVEIRTYQVGFGDCFLLTFKYAGFDRNMLIDFGSMALPEGSPSNHMRLVADDIKAVANDRLNVVVATHRHADHISGFTTNKKRTAPGDIIRSCKPQLVVQPWTEDPRAAKNAKEASKSAGSKAKGLRPALTEGAARRAFTASLDRMHDVAAAAVAVARQFHAVDPAAAKQLEYLGRDNIKNKAAVENLMTMGRNVYVKSGDRLPLTTILPGVKVHVLGPPSLKQSGAIAKQRSKDAEEFWHLQAAAAGMSAEHGRILFPEFASSSTPLDARWLRYRMRNMRADTLLSIVRSLDKQMNNTSVILLLEIGKKVLLFPGDAQIENWLHALGQKKYQKLLRKVDLYKVGHHGSLNATPKTLWSMFDRKGDAGKRGRLKSLLSTLTDVHGHVEADTEVPRRKLVTALRKSTDLVSTQSYRTSELSRVTTVTIG